MGNLKTNLSLILKKLDIYLLYCNKIGNNFSFVKFIIFLSYLYYFYNIYIYIYKESNILIITSFEQALCMCLKILLKKYPLWNIIPGQNK